ncbi:MAG TPA: glycosyltransferase [Xanthobacteraceae bacterium]|nr:glycosyltransferase [Xanthobacteraceae bacterium]
MISVVIPALNSERVLVPLLASLVPGSAQGLLREVILADGGSTDETEKIADIAGCNFQRAPHDLGARLRAAAQSARGNWLMFLDPAARLEEGWTRELRIFLERAERLGETEKRAAAFKLVHEDFRLSARFAAAVRIVLSGKPRAEQGLLISKRFYQMLGGHKDGAHAQEQLLARIGRRRIVTLRAQLALRRL